MRFRSISIPAYGPFSGFQSDYGDGNPDFHLVFGPNEAGKSSLLRAISALLYGIPNQSADNFLHDYADLQLAAEIEKRDGQRLAFKRFKGRKNTLRDNHGTALDDTTLEPYLGGVDAHYFATVFGLDSDQLQKGADSLLSRDGDLGQALLATGTGGSLVQQALEQFTERAAQYYRGRASKSVSIRPAVKRHKEQLRAVREHTVAIREWEQLERQLLEKQTAVERLEQRSADIERQLDWIQRCRDALPTVAQLNDQNRQIAALPVLPQLPEDFSVRARQARDKSQQSAEALQRERQNVERIRAQLDKCAMAPAVVAEATVLDELHTRMGVYRSNTRRLAELRRDMDAREPALSAGMLTFGMAGPSQGIETLRVLPALQLAFDEASASLTLAQHELDQNRAQLDELENSVASDQAALEQVKDDPPQVLQAALDAATRVMQHRNRLPELSAQADRLQRELSQARAMLPGVALDGSELAALVLPGIATIRRFRELFDNNQRDLTGAGEQLQARQQQRKQLERELNQLQQSGQLPSTESLVAARAHRQALWQRLLAQLQNTTTDGEDTVDFALQMAYPAAVLDADRIADALREDAELVARAEQLQFHIKTVHAEIADLNTHLSTLHADQLELQRQWQAQWQECSMTAGTPAEMEDWREHWLSYRQCMLAIGSNQTEIEALRNDIASATTALATAMGDTAGSDFEWLYNRARALQREREAAIGKRAGFNERIHKQRALLERHQSEAAQLQRAQRTASEVWDKRCREVGLETGLTVRTGNKLMDERRELLRHYEQWQKLSVEAAGLARDIDAYEAQVDQYSARLAVAGDSVLAREGALWSALQQALDAQRQHKTLSDQLQHAVNVLDQTELVAKQSAERLDQLRLQARLEVSGELEPLLARIEQRERLLQGAEALNQSLIGQSRGEDIADFMQRVVAEDSATLVSRHADLSRDKTRLQEDLQMLRDELGSLRRDRDQLADAGDLAARHRQQAESIATGLIHDASEFVRLRLASTFLEQQRERFREQNQAPLLAASSRLFKAVTLNSYERLVPDYDARDEAVIVAERADGSRVPVAGMSEGTRDQLYLSLRLAALEQHAKTTEPMPLIMDDLLMTFDDQRSVAMLREIAALAQHTQIFLFTHHRHLIQLCQSELDSQHFIVHNL